jgi:ubiquinone/menaquinone biosynthesis C-methylase UbiE
MIEIARAKAGAQKVMNVDFEVAALDDLSNRDETYDAVLGLSILHLLEDRDEGISRVWAMLKPDGLFISSTACLAETMKCFKIIGPVGKFFGLLPTIRVFTVQDLVTSMTRGGFEIEHEWQPGKGKSMFIVARKPAWPSPPSSRES